jgi:hypothetical protein
MKKLSSNALWAVVIATVLAFGCQEESLRFKGADCGGCEDPYPPVINPDPSRCGDVVISNISWSIVGDFLMIEVELKNVGAQPVYDDNYVLQSYLSPDDQLSPSDAGAGGVVREIDLAPGASVVHNTQGNPALLKDNKFIIVTATLDAKSNDCNTANNIGVKSIW